MPVTAYLHILHRTRAVRLTSSSRISGCFAAGRHLLPRVQKKKGRLHAPCLPSLSPPSTQLYPSELQGHLRYGGSPDHSRKVSLSRLHGFLFLTRVCPCSREDGTGGVGHAIQELNPSHPNRLYDDN